MGQITEDGGEWSHPYRYHGGRGKGGRPCIMEVHHDMYHGIFIIRCILEGEGGRERERDVEWVG